MADNVVVTAGTGTIVAADEVTDATLGTVKVQYVKIMDGALDGTTKALVDSNGLMISVIGPGLTSLQLIDDPVFTDDAAFTAATSKVMVMGGQYQSSPNTLDDNDAGSLLLDSSHRLVPAPSAALLVDAASFTATTSSGVLTLTVADTADTTRTATNAKVHPASLDLNANQRVVLPTLRKLTSTFNRPADTTAYTANDAVADNTTAGSVTKLSFTIPKSAGTVTRVRIKKNATADNPSWRLWLFDTTFTPGAGDNAAFAAPLTDSLGYVDVDGSTDGSDVEVGWSTCNIPCTGTTLFGVLQTLTAWTPASGETITVDIWVYPG